MTFSVVGAETAPGMWPATAVDRLDLAPVALPRPCVQQQPGAGQRRRAVRVEQRERARARGEVAGSAGCGSRSPAGPSQAGEAAVQDPHVRVARPAQQPPGAGRGPALAAVVDDDRRAGRHARAAHRRAEGRRVGQRMPAARAGRAGQLGVQVDEDGARDVPGLVVGPAVGGSPAALAAQLPADVQQHRRAWRQPARSRVRMRR